MYNPQKIEKEMERKWKESNVPGKSREKNKDKKKFYFIDGPPYATGHIHLGTAYNKILKDFYVRFKRMMGFYVRYQPGYDTHGLPIENQVEKKLGLKDKNGIEDYGVEKFNEECRKFATEFITKMNKEFENLGIWMDWDNPYLTLKNDYIENSWYTFKKAFERGLVFKDTYPLHVCPHCETSVSYNEIEYNDTTENSIYVKFPIKGEKGEYFLIWTTTPWTIPANTGIMVHPNYDYSKVKTYKGILVIATELVDKVMEKLEIADYKILDTKKGKEFKDIEYTHPFEDFMPIHKKIKHIIVTSSRYVTLEGGTGLVHTAPGHGKEDYEVGKEKGLERLSPVKFDGTFTKEVGKYENVYVKDADAPLVEEMKKRDMLLGEEKITHSYPFCWRCKSPLLQLAAPQWFFKVTAIRDNLLKENEKVNWIPKWAKARFKDWLTNLDDWPITRKRYWGIPTPLWICEKCGEKKVVASVKELGKELEDLHKPFIDEVVFDCKCGGKMKRIPEVMDVWYDSGVCSWVSLCYPKEKDLFEEIWPPDLNIEGSDQFRGWWNSQMILSVITFGENPFKNVVTHGMILDIQGKEMSKSLGNVITPQEAIDKYGRDSLRLYFLSSPPGDNFYFSFDELKETFKQINMLWNVSSFFKNYCKEIEKESKLSLEDRWILSRLNTIIKKTTLYNKKYQSYKGIEILKDFLVNDLSRTYIKLIRERTWPSYEGKDKEAAFYTLNVCLKNLIKLFAPICPFITDKIWWNMGYGESCHMAEWPKTDESRIDEKLEKDFEIIQKISEASNAIRQEENVGLRYPVKKLVVSGSEEVREAIGKLEDTLKKMTNVKEVELGKLSLDYRVKLSYSKAGPKYGKDVKKIENALEKEDKAKLVKEVRDRGFAEVAGFKLEEEDLVIEVASKEGKGFRAGDVSGIVTLDLEETKEIIEESLAKELIRNIQQTRKEMNLVVKQKVKLKLETDKKTEKVVKKWSEEIKKEVGAKEISFGKAEGHISAYKDTQIKFELELVE